MNVNHRCSAIREHAGVWYDRLCLYQHLKWFVGSFFLRKRLLGTLFEYEFHYKICQRKNVGVEIYFVKFVVSPVRVNIDRRCSSYERMVVSESRKISGAVFRNTLNECTPLDQVNTRLFWNIFVESWGKIPARDRRHQYLKILTKSF